MCAKINTKNSTNHSQNVKHKGEKISKYSDGDVHVRFGILWWTQGERKGEMTVRCGKYKCLKRSLLFHTNAFSLLEKFKLQWQHQRCTCQKKAQGPQMI